MATLEYWIQLENRAWDASPNNIDRITGRTIQEETGLAPVDVTLTSPGTGVSHARKMYNPIRGSDGNVVDALILRRYRPPLKPDESDAWTVPDDRKVNPWDLNEPDPTDNGTMGTIPGPVIECNVGDSVVVHYRNMDMRTRTVVKTKQVCFELPFAGKVCFPVPSVEQEPLPAEKLVHSLHPHGFVFKATSDGAYPLSPPDPAQSIPPAEAAAWASVPGFSGSLKKGDRVPQGGTFTYRWNTIGWPSTANVWLYHDHSICDMENVELGAIGIIVIHNPADTEQEVDIRDAADPMKLDPAFLPDGSPNGSPVDIRCVPFPRVDPRVLPHDLEGLGLAASARSHHGDAAQVGDIALKAATHRGGAHKHEDDSPNVARLIKRGELLLELDAKLEKFERICLPRYDTPPDRALYLQLFHTLFGVPGMAINGRLYMGNTPTMVAGRETRMRFGVVGMGSDAHTFHIHGHRWTIPGPQGSTPGAIQSSAQVEAVSQFEDTRMFGAANSFAFTIDERSGSFMRAGSADPDDAVGEWHMHCHVLSHMMTGMMGSLLVIRGGELALPLPVGVPCAHVMADGDHEMPDGGAGTIHTVNMQMSAYVPVNLTISKGDQVRFVNKDSFQHTVDWDTAGAPANSGTISAQGAAGDTYLTPAMNTAGLFAFHCAFHGAAGAGMHGTITVNP